MTSNVDPDVTTSMVTFRIAASASDKAAVLRLRDAVYVQDQGRLTDVGQMADTFDRYQAVYILADGGDGPVGAIKVIPDSPVGLPCDSTADVSALREHGRLVEFGHLVTLPRARGQSIGVALMREALVYSVQEHRATHIIGDLFVHGDGALRDFYSGLGFTPLGEPYRDDRFVGAPLSVVAALDIAEAVRRCRSSSGSQARRLRYFFSDYDKYAYAV
jgi:putrescine aminotransferase